MIEYSGQCHCGALTVDYRTALAPAAWSVRECQCTFCRAHGAATTSDAAGQLSFQTSEPDMVQRYRFGTQSGEALLCRACGVFLGVVTESARGRLGVLNIPSLRPRPVNLPGGTPMKFAEESADTRRARWLERWTPLLAGSL